MLSAAFFSSRHRSLSRNTQRGLSVQKHSGMFLKRKPLISRYALYLAFSESQPHICVSCHIERDEPDG
ncbi:hypothetical protein QQF64_009463 [Cirrhinus molitorella]|uniref:Uncharacterized protein n=1 Tax=Cirrhinus molitorella TaxID=172907 RepID=A0ABR3M3M7_9TELE